MRVYNPWIRIVFIHLPLTLSLMILCVLCSRQCNEVKKEFPKVFNITSHCKSHTPAAAYKGVIPLGLQISQGHRVKLRPYSVLLQALQFTIGNLQVSKHGLVDWSLADRDKQIHWHGTLWHHFIPRPITPYWSLLQLLSKSHNTNKAAALTQKFSKPSLASLPDTRFQQQDQSKHNLKVF